MCEPSRPACLDRGGQKGETDMELGSWSIIQAPSLLALIPLVVMIVLIFRGKSNVSAIMVGVLVGALLLGQDLGAMAKAFATSLGSSTALIGLIIMMGAGLGVLMSEAGVTHTLVYWIVKRIGVNTQTKGKIALVVVSIIVCGLLGTLGGGNHFIEVDKDDEGNLYIVVHSGSRHLGVEVASYYQEAGYKVLNRTDDASIEALIARMKAEGREKEIQKELKKLKNLKQTSIPKALAYVSGELFEQYIHDMKIVQQFAALNRQAMMDEIVGGMKLHVEEQFTTIHNYIDTDAMILRKGAVSAKAGEQLLIPINMRDGSLLCVGKGNEDWNCSAPHGAGRLMSRADAKQSFTVSEFKKQMAEVYTTSVSKATLDECPMAYKGMQDILDNIGPTAEVRKIIRPIYNFKAGDED